VVALRGYLRAVELVCHQQLPRKQTILCVSQTRVSSHLTRRNSAFVLLIRWYAFVTVAGLLSATLLTSCSQALPPDRSEANLSVHDAICEAGEPQLS
jgi:hypothetical protein